MANDSPEFSDYSSLQRPAKKKAVVVEGSLDEHASSYADNIQEPTYRKIRRSTSPLGASPPVKRAVKVASPKLVAAREKLPLAKRDASEELDELLNILPDDPRLTSEGDLIEPIVWRKNVTLEYWDDLIDRTWFKPYLHCVDLVDGNLVIYERPLHAREMLAEAIDRRLTRAQIQDPVMNTDFVEYVVPSIPPSSSRLACPKDLQRKAVDWLSYAYPPAEPGGVAPIHFVQLVIVAKIGRSGHSFVGGHPAIRATIQQWVRYDRLLHSNLLPVIAANTPNLPAGGVPNANQAVCIACVECGDYATDANQNFQPGYLHPAVLIPRYALYARTPNYQTAYQAAASAVPPLVPLFPPGSPYAGDLSLDIWSYVNSDDFRSSFHPDSDLERL